MLPRFRENRRAARTNEEWAATASDESKGKRFSRFLVHWIKVSWKDVILLILLGVASQLIYRTPLAATRTFPITFTSSGEIVYPDFAYPNRGWVLSPLDSGLISALVPIGLFVLAQIRIRSFWDMNNAIFGVLYSLVLATLFQVVIKQLIGGFRPYFLTVCQPDLSRAATHNTTGLNGVGYQQLMYSVDVCTNPDKNELKNAMTSFPSGHSAAAWAGFMFLFLWMNAKLKVWSNHQASFHWLALLMAPLLGAVLMVCALSTDQAHHWYDILAGSLIGIFMAVASYRACYAAVFDWRYNHIPLKRTKVVDYTLGLTADTMERAVFVRKLGWGRPKRTRIGRAGTGKVKPVNGVASTRSSDTYARNTIRISPQDSGLRHPEMTRTGGRPAVGDNMV